MKNYKRLFIISIVLAAFCMRAPITTIGPLVSEIKADLNMSSAAAGSLTTIPMLIFAFASFFSGAFLPRFKAGSSAILCFILIAVGLVIRSFTNLFGLYVGTVLIGLGIGVLNVMLPALNREKMPGSIGQVTGIYNLSLNGMAGIASGFCTMIAAAIGGWRPATVIWGIFPLLAIPLWAFLSRQPQFDDKTGQASSPIAATKKFFSSQAMRVALVMAFQSFVYYSVVAWGAQIIRSKGLSADGAAQAMLWFQVLGLLPSFAVPILMTKEKYRTPVILTLGVVYLTGLTILLTAQTPTVAVIGFLLCGVVSGSNFSYTLTLITLSGKSKEETTWVSGFSQMFGYAVSAIGPTLFGAIFDAIGNWNLPIMILMALIICFAATGLVTGRNLGKE